MKITRRRFGGLIGGTWLSMAQQSGARPLMVLLHGAGGRGAGITRRLSSFADDAGVTIVAPDSRADTWDGVRGRVGADRDLILREVDRAVKAGAIDRERISIGGFSDGASYALTVGLQHGDLFRRIVAFSPGFFVGGEVRGRPRIFISHGTADTVLPIDRCSRVIVPALQKQGYDVTFRQFDGGHEIPQNIAAAGFRFAAV